MYLTDKTHGTVRPSSTNLRERTKGNQSSKCRDKINTPENGIDSLSCQRVLASRCPVPRTHGEVSGLWQERTTNLGTRRRQSGKMEDVDDFSPTYVCYDGRRTTPVTCRLLSCKSTIVWVSSFLTKTRLPYYQYYLRRLLKLVNAKEMETDTRVLH